MAKKKGRQRIVIILLMLALVLVSAFNVYLINLSPFKSQAAQPVSGQANISLPGEPLSLDGYVVMEVSTSGTNVYMRSGCRQITAGTTEDQAASIEAGLKGDVPVRPISHDIAADILESVGASTVFAKVDDMREGIYYARLVIKQNSTYYALDSRPSDAIAIALRSKAPMYIKKGLLDRLAEDIC